MKNAKYILIMLLSAWLSVLLVGCGNNTATQTSASTDTSPPAEIVQSTNASPPSSEMEETASVTATEFETSTVPDTTVTETTVSPTEATGESPNSSASLPSVTIPGLEYGAKIYQQIQEEKNHKPTFAETGIPAVALTFDDGPRAGTTDAILDVLEKYNVPATFFIVGENVSQHPEALKRMAELGCELGTHTYNHKDLTTLSAKKVAKQIKKSIKLIQKAAGASVTLVRPPYGSINASVKEQLNLPIILWSLDTLDWKTRNAKRTIKRVKKNVRGGDIILMHDLYEETAAAVRKIVPWLIKKGYKIMTVSELYEYYGEDLTLHIGHGSSG